MEKFDIDFPTIMTYTSPTEVGKYIKTIKVSEV